MSSGLTLGAFVAACVGWFGASIGVIMILLPYALQRRIKQQHRAQAPLHERGVAFGRVCIALEVWRLCCVVGWVVVAHGARTGVNDAAQVALSIAAVLGSGGCLAVCYVAIAAMRRAGAKISPEAPGMIAQVAVADQAPPQQPGQVAGGPAVELALDRSEVGAEAGEGERHGSAPVEPPAPPDRSVSPARSQPRRSPLRKLSNPRLHRGAHYAPDVDAHPSNGQVGSAIGADPAASSNGSSLRPYRAADVQAWLRGPAFSAASVDVSAAAGRESGVGVGVSQQGFAPGSNGHLRCQHAVALDSALSHARRLRQAVHVEQRLRLLSRRLLAQSKLSGAVATVSSELVQAMGLSSCLLLLPAPAHLADAAVGAARVSPRLVCVSEVLSASFAHRLHSAAAGAGSMAAAADGGRCSAGGGGGAPGLRFEADGAPAPSAAGHGSVAARVAAFDPPRTHSGHTVFAPMAARVGVAAQRRPLEAPAGGSTSGILGSARELLLGARQWSGPLTSGAPSLNSSSHLSARTGSHGAMTRGSSADVASAASSQFLRAGAAPSALRNQPGLHSAASGRWANTCVMGQPCFAGGCAVSALHFAARAAISSSHPVRLRRHQLRDFLPADCLLALGEDAHFLAIRVPLPHVGPAVQAAGVQPSRPATLRRTFSPRTRSGASRQHSPSPGDVPTLADATSSGAVGGSAAAAPVTARRGSMQSSEAGSPRVHAGSRVSAASALGGPVFGIMLLHRESDEPKDADAIAPLLLSSESEDADECCSSPAPETAALGHTARASASTARVSAPSSSARAMSPLPSARASPRRRLAGADEPSFRTSPSLQSRGRIPAPGAPSGLPCSVANADVAHASLHIVADAPPLPPSSVPTCFACNPGARSATRLERLTACFRRRRRHLPFSAADMARWHPLAAQRTQNARCEAARAADGCVQGEVLPSSQCPESLPRVLSSAGASVGAMDGGVAGLSAPAARACLSSAANTAAAPAHWPAADAPGGGSAGGGGAGASERAYLFTRQQQQQQHQQHQQRLRSHHMLSRARTDRGAIDAVPQHLASAAARELARCALRLATAAQPKHARSQDDPPDPRDLARGAAVHKLGVLRLISHNVRTPLNGALGLLSMLAETSLSPDQRDMLAGVQRSCDSLQRAMDDVVEVAKADPTGVPLKHLAFDIRDCVEGAIDLVSAHANARRVALSYILSEDLPSVAHGDAARIRQVLVNLLSNAVRHTADGEVVLSVRALEVAQDPRADDVVVQSLLSSSPSAACIIAGHADALPVGDMIASLSPQRAGSSAARGGLHAANFASAADAARDQHSLLLNCSSDSDSADLAGGPNVFVSAARVDTVADTAAVPVVVVPAVAPLAVPGSSDAAAVVTTATTAAAAASAAEVAGAAATVLAGAVLPTTLSPVIHRVPTQLAVAKPATTDEPVQAGLPPLPAAAPSRRLPPSSTGFVLATGRSSAASSTGTARAPALTLFVAAEVDDLLSSVAVANSQPAAALRPRVSASGNSPGVDASDSGTAASSDDTDVPQRRAPFPFRPRLATVRSCNSDDDDAAHASRAATEHGSDAARRRVTGERARQDPAASSDHDSDDTTSRLVLGLLFEVADTGAGVSESLLPYMFRQRPHDRAVFDMWSATRRTSSRWQAAGAAEGGSGTSDGAETDPGASGQQQAPPRLRAHRRSPHSGAGLGMGLAVCSELVHVMGGRMWLVTGAGAGTRVCFTVELGVESAALEPCIPVFAGAHETAAAGAQGGVAAAPQPSDAVQHLRRLSGAAVASPIARAAMESAAELAAAESAGMDAARQGIVPAGEDAQHALAFASPQRPRGMSLSDGDADTPSQRSRGPALTPVQHPSRPLLADRRGQPSSTSPPRKLLDALQGRLVYVLSPSEHVRQCLREMCSSLGCVPTAMEVLSEGQLASLPLGPAGRGAGAALAIVDVPCSASAPGVRIGSFFSRRTDASRPPETELGVRRVPEDPHRSAAADPGPVAQPVFVAEATSSPAGGAGVSMESAGTCTKHAVADAVSVLLRTGVGVVLLCRARSDAVEQGVTPRKLAGIAVVNKPPRRVRVARALARALRQAARRLALAAEDGLPSGHCEGETGSDSSALHRGSGAPQQLPLPPAISQPSTWPVLEAASSVGAGVSPAHKPPRSRSSSSSARVLSAPRPAHWAANSPPVSPAQVLAPSPSCARAACGQPARRQRVSSSSGMSASAASSLRNGRFPGDADAREDARLARRVAPMQDEAAGTPPVSPALGQLEASLRHFSDLDGAATAASATAALPVPLPAQEMTGTLALQLPARAQAGMLTEDRPLGDTLADFPAQQPATALPGAGAASAAQHSADAVPLPLVASCLGATTNADTSAAALVVRAVSAGARAEAGAAVTACKPSDAGAVATSPAVRSHTTSSMNSKVGSDSASAARVASLRVLVVDDTLTNQKVAVRMLQSLGCASACVAEDGLVALRALQEQHFDVVLMDVNMPVMNGLECTREIHARWDAGTCDSRCTVPLQVVALAAAVELIA